jgi:phosphohistidine phosphatase
MAKQLWLLRHGEAEPHGTRPDVERRLTERGERQARDAGRALARFELPIHVVYTSPKVRARDTARLACAELGIEPIEHAALAEDFDLRDALELLEACDVDQRVLIVGHNPDFAQVVYDLTGARAELRKGAVAGVRVPGGASGELIALLQPRELAPLAG